MKQLTFLLLAILLPLAAQSQGCDALIRDARNLARKLQFDEAVKKVEAAKCCAAQADIDKLYAEIFAGLKKQTREAEEAKKTAETSEKKALIEKGKAETSERNAISSEKKAIVEKLRADSISETARRQALRAYANDLAYKSQIALERGDRTTAFRLAEFAHRYVDDDNLNVTRALCDALYYNDRPADPTHPPLPWASNLQGHTSHVLSVAFSPDGQRLATGSWDYTAKIWDLITGKAVLTLEGHTSYVESVAFSLDGKRLATGSWDKTAKIWDLTTGKAVLTLEGHTSNVESVVFSLDGKRLATGSWDHTAKIWDLTTGKAALTL